MLVLGWPAAVGERSVLVIRPYLYRLNQLPSLADTIGSYYGLMPPLPLFYPQNWV